MHGRSRGGCRPWQGSLEGTTEGCLETLAGVLGLLLGHYRGWDLCVRQTVPHAGILGQTQPGLWYGGGGLRGSQELLGCEGRIAGRRRGGHIGRRTSSCTKGGIVEVKLRNSHAMQSAVWPHTNMANSYFDTRHVS